MLLNEYMAINHQTTVTSHLKMKNNFLNFTATFYIPNSLYLSNSNPSIKYERSFPITYESGIYFCFLSLLPPMDNGVTTTVPHQHKKK